MNFPVADTLELAGPENPIYHAGGDYSAAEVMEFARYNNPIMRQAELNKEIAEYSLRSAKGSWAPTISIGAGLSDSYYKRYGTENQPYREQMDVNFGQYVGVSMSIPIFDGLSRSNTVKKARNQAREARLDYDRRLYELQSSVEQAVTDRRQRKVGLDCLPVRQAQIRRGADELPRHAETDEHVVRVAGRARALPTALRRETPLGGLLPHKQTLPAIKNNNRIWQIQFLKVFTHLRASTRCRWQSTWPDLRWRSPPF